MERVHSIPAFEPVTCSIHDWQSMRFELLFVFDNPIPAGVANGSHDRRGEYSAWLIRHGSAQVVCDGETADVGPGQWLFCFGNRITQQLSPDIHLLSVRVAHCWPDESPMFVNRRKLLQFPAADHPRLESAALTLIGDVGPIDWRHDHPVYMFQWQTRLGYRAYLKHQMHLLKWTSRVADILQQRGWQMRIPRGIDSRLSHILNYIDRLPFDAPYPSAMLAGNTGLSVWQLNRMCTQAFGLTMYGYWEQRRIQHARFLLEQPLASAKRIALTLGFRQLSHFSAWFKRLTGNSPRAYRKTKLIPSPAAQPSD